MNASKEEKKELKRLNPSHTLLPILCGIIGVLILFWIESDSIKDTKLDISIYTWIFFAAALFTIIIRDLAGMLRLYLLADKKLSFGAVFRIRMLYEFTSAITPSVTGGSTLEVLFLHKEGIKVSKSTSIMLLSLFLDELFFVIGFPILLLLLPYEQLFAMSGTFSPALVSIFFIGYTMKFVWTLLLFWSIFIKPRTLSIIIQKVFSLKFMKRWRRPAFRTSFEIAECSKDMKAKPTSFWVGTFGSTILIWCSRFFIVNLLIMGFVPISDQLMVFGRQLVTMIVLLISPTPGGSGFIEVLFSSYLGEFIPQGITVVLIAAAWRVLTFYNYLIIGVMITPKWIKNNFSKKTNKSRLK